MMTATTSAEVQKAHKMRDGDMSSPHALKEAVVTFYDTVQERTRALDGQRLKADLLDVARSLINVTSEKAQQQAAMVSKLLPKLENVRKRTTQAFEEQQRLYEESPTAHEVDDPEQPEDIQADLRKIMKQLSAVLDAYQAIAASSNQTETQSLTRGDDHGPEIQPKKEDKSMQLITPMKDGSKTDIGLKAEKRTRVAQALGGMLASTYSLYVKSLFYHWNVTGPNFHAFHALFEQHYQNLHEAGDDLAERIRALGHYTPGTLKAFSSLSIIQDDDKLPEKANDMLENLKEANEACSVEARRVLEIAEEAGDEVTVDMMVDRMRFHDEAVWMLSASMENA